MNILFTSYFCTRNDPQRNKQVNENDFNYIKKYYNSVKKLNLNCLIFHDNLSDDFIKKYSTDKINFHIIKLDNYRNKSLNDIRFLAYYDYLLKHPEINKVFMTDVNDVVINMNPFNIINDDSIYIGLDRDRKISHYFFKQIIMKSYGSYDKFKKIFEKKILNAGILGGKYNIVIKFLKLMKNEFDMTIKENNANMAVLNYVALTYFDKIITGYPLCSKFYEYEKRKDVYFTHK